MTKLEIAIDGKSLILVVFSIMCSVLKYTEHGIKPCLKCLMCSQWANITLFVNKFKLFTNIIKRSTKNSKTKYFFGIFKMIHIYTFRL